jgi:hypothetical protein
VVALSYVWNEPLLPPEVRYRGRESPLIDFGDLLVALIVIALVLGFVLLLGLIIYILLGLAHFLWSHSVVSLREGVCG